MKVIVLNNFRSLKNPGTITEVKRGYAVNYLIPRGIVTYATPQALSELDANKSVMIEKDQKRMTIATKAKAALDDQIFVLVRVAGEDNRLYGSVSNKDISEAINNHLNSNDINFIVEKTDIDMNINIKHIDIFYVKVKLHGDIYANIRLNVCKSVNDAKNNLERHEKEKKAYEIKEEK